MLAPADPAKRMIVSWQEATQLVRARSTDLATAYAEIRRAEAQTRVALAAVLPTANATASLPHQLLTRQTQTADGRTVDTPTGDYVNLGISASQSIVNLQAWHTIKTTKEQVTVNTLSAEDTTRVITLQVATSIVGVVASERIAELNRVGLRSALERRNLTSRKRNLGVATGLDVVRADQDVSFARATLVTGDESLRRSREALGLALGIPDQVGVPAGVKIDEVVASAERTCPRIGTLAERADIAAQQKRIEIADRNVHNVELGFLPTLSATSNYATSTQDSRGANLPATWSISAVLSVPIWDGGARYGVLRSNRALRDEAGYALEAATRNATVQIEQARRSISVAEASRDVAQQTRDLAAEVDQLTQIGYRAGQGGITSLELVIAAAALRQAEISLALREFDVVSARLDALFSLARCAPLGAQR
ncbi:MAG: Heavy metal efflux outer membrane protein CzcC family [Myxococcaceae bacterium]|nr:Heavy metal efflux outer membrane protein CzcC family [Myxococcaceae bacterium]MDB5213458.1 Heavy metal efflux outer membrane protein CzcC family [Myxococcaceae bacterium]